MVLNAEISLGPWKTDPRAFSTPLGLYPLLDPSALPTKMRAIQELILNIFGFQMSVAGAHLLGMLVPQVNHLTVF